MSDELFKEDEQTELEKRVRTLELFLSAFTARNLAGLKASDIIKATAEFGGDGSNGALTIAGGTTTLDMASARIYERNYTQISITGTGALAFSNPATAGTVILLRSQGDVTITSTATQAIDIRSLGGTGGSGGAIISPDDTQGGGSGGGGASMTTNGNAGSAGGGAGNQTSGSAGTNTNWIGQATGGGGGTGTSGGSAGTAPLHLSSAAQYFRFLVIPGSGGGGGSSGGAGTPETQNAGGNGGRGAGALIIECGGNLNFTGTINGSGSNGASGGANGGGGGGGGAGSIVILYNRLIANTGTLTTTGGSGGTGFVSGGAGGAGFSLVGENRFFL